MHFCGGGFFFVGCFWRWWWQRGGFWGVLSKFHCIFCSLLVEEVSIQMGVTLLLQLTVSFQKVC